MYDVTRRETFTNLSDIWAKEIDLYLTNQNCIKMLVGNKVDKVCHHVLSELANEFLQFFSVFCFSVHNIVLVASNFGIQLFVPLNDILCICVIIVCRKVNVLSPKRRGLTSLGNMVAFFLSAVLKHESM